MSDLFKDVNLKTTTKDSTFKAKTKDSSLLSLTASEWDNVLQRYVLKDNQGPRTKAKDNIPALCMYPYHSWPSDTIVTVAAYDRKLNTYFAREGI